MKRKLILLGIDGLEPNLVNTFVAQRKLETFSSPSFTVRLASTFPPDSYLAWPSIFTGQDLAHFVNEIMLSDLGTSQLGHRVRDRIAGNTFWDRVGLSGHRVCIINPFLAFPPWEVNGFMISGPVEIKNGISASFPKWVISKYDAPKMGGISEGFSLLPWEHSIFYRNCCSETMELARFTAKVIEHADFDLVFVTFLALDRIEHFFWRFGDPADPDKPFVNPHSESLANFYVLLDRVIGTFLRRFGHEYTIVAFGDHGHGPRPYYLLALNEWLRRKKLLSSGEENIAEKLKEFLTVITLQMLYTSGLDSFAYRIHRKFNPSRFRHENFVLSSGAGTSPLFGFKQYGAFKMPDRMTGEKYQYENVISLLRSYGLLEQACAGRQDYTSSGRLSIPVFKLPDRFGLYHRLYAPLIMKNFTRRLISGGHKDTTAMYVWCNDDTLKQSKSSGSIMDVFSSILNFFGLEPDRNSLWDIDD